MEWKRNPYKFFLCKPEGKNPLGRSRGGLEDHIKINLKK
jgi:hypothetical protein